MLKAHSAALTEIKLPALQLCHVPSIINSLIGHWAKIPSDLANYCSEMFTFENGTEFVKCEFSFCYPAGYPGYPGYPAGYPDSDYPCKWLPTYQLDQLELPKTSG